MIDIQDISGQCFVTYEDLHGRDVLPNDLQRCVIAHYRQFISRTVAMTLYHQDVSIH